jgi:hypothetical protein
MRALAVTRPLALALPLLAFASCAEPPPATSPVVLTTSQTGAPAAVSAAPQTTSAAPQTASVAPSGHFDALSRLELNRTAAQLDLPLFWVDDTNGSGAVDPDEITALRGAPKPAAGWVEGGRFTPAFVVAYDTMRHAKEAADMDKPSLPDAEKRRRAAVRAELAQGRPSLVRSDFRGASAEDRAIVEHVLNAAEIIERIYGKQRATGDLAAQILEDDTASRALFRRNQGPWCEAPLTEKNPDCNALAARPPRISGMYPASLQRDPKFCEALEARKGQKALLDPFTVVIEDGGALKASPYNVVYQAEMTAVARELGAAAAAVTSPGEAPFKAYLQAASKAFTTNDWASADEAWAKMSVNNSRYYLRAAPDEVYFEPCNHKAGFHMSFARINQASLAWQKKLEPVKTEMETKLAKLAGAPYRPRNVTFHLPDFIDIILTAGDSRSALGATIGQSLPNFGRVASEGRGRTVAMANLYTDKDSEAALAEQVRSVFCPGALPQGALASDIAMMTTVLHEAAHNLGPAHGYKAFGKDDLAAFGGPLASTLEELKAQQSAMFLTDWLAGKGIIDAETAKKAHARDVTWAFGHISDGMTTANGAPKPYSQLASIQVGFLFKASAMSFQADKMAANGKDKGCFDLALDKFPAAVVELEKQVLGIKARGDKAAALRLKDEFVDQDNEWKKLRAVIAERWLRTPKASFVYAVDL